MWRINNEKRMSVKIPSDILYNVSLVRNVSEEKYPDIFVCPSIICNIIDYGRRVEPCHGHHFEGGTEDTHWANIEHHNFWKSCVFVDGDNSI